MAVSGVLLCLLSLSSCLGAIGKPGWQIRTQRKIHGLVGGGPALAAFGLVTKVVRLPVSVVRGVSRVWSGRLRRRKQRSNIAENLNSLKRGQLIYAKWPPEGFSRVVRVLSVDTRAGVVEVESVGPEKIIKQILDMDIQLGEEEIELIALVLEGKSEEILERSKEEGFNPNVCDPEGRTPIYHAARQGNRDIVEILRRLGGDIFSRSKGNSTLLYIAAQNNHPEVVRYLLDHGLNTELHTTQGATPLHISSQRGYDQIVEMLLKAGANPNAAFPPSYATPLYVASILENLSTIRLLLDNGADLEQGSGKMRSTPLHAAVRTGKPGVVDLLIERKANITAVANNGVNCLLSACTGGNAYAVKRLVEAGSDPTSESPSGSNGVLIATLQGNCEIVKYLLSMGTKPDHTLSNGVTSLLLAAERGDSEIVSALLEAGADPNRCSKAGVPPLTIASYKGHARIVYELLQAGANPNPPKHPQLGTPLEAASRSIARQAAQEIVKILRAAGAGD